MNLSLSLCVCVCVCVSYTHTHICIYIYIYIYVCVCVCVCVQRERERERAEPLRIPIISPIWVTSGNLSLLKNYEILPLVINWLSLRHSSYWQIVFCIYYVSSQKQIPDAKWGEAETWFTWCCLIIMSIMLILCGWCWPVTNEITGLYLEVWDHCQRTIFLYLHQQSCQQWC